MKKNYSNPKFKLVLLDSNDLICTSGDGPDFGGTTSEDVNKTDAKRRNIWDE